MFSEIVSLIAVGLCWGGTNPIIRKNSKSIVKVEASSAVAHSPTSKLFNFCLYCNCKLDFGRKTTQKKDDYGCNFDSTWNLSVLFR
nr:unnamed protein product [Callosobruchus analis]